MRKRLCFLLLAVLGLPTAEAAAGPARELPLVAPLLHGTVPDVRASLEASADGVVANVDVQAELAPAASASGTLDVATLSPEPPPLSEEAAGATPKVVAADPLASDLGPGGTESGRSHAVRYAGASIAGVASLLALYVVLATRKRGGSGNR